jgi:hypothetical protein
MRVFETLFGPATPPLRRFDLTGFKHVFTRSVPFGYRYPAGVATDAMGSPLDWPLTPIACNRDSLERQNSS